MVRILWASCFLNLAGMVSNAVISATSLASRVSLFLRMLPVSVGVGEREETGAASSHSSHNTDLLGPGCLFTHFQRS